MTNAEMFQAAKPLMVAILDAACKTGDLDHVMDVHGACSASWDALGLAADIDTGEATGSDVREDLVAACDASNDRWSQLVAAVAPWPTTWERGLKDVRKQISDLRLYLEAVALNTF